MRLFTQSYSADSRRSEVRLGARDVGPPTIETVVRELTRRTGVSEIPLIEEFSSQLLGITELVRCEVS